MIVKDCQSVNEFLEKYMKKERFSLQSKEYKESHIKYCEEMILKTGYCLISNHGSITGETLFFYKM